MKNNKKNKTPAGLLFALLALCGAVGIGVSQTNTGYSVYEQAATKYITDNEINNNTSEVLVEEIESITTLDSIPDYAGKAYVELYGNVPDFSDEDKKSLEAFEIYSNLDELGRCGVAYANICIELMPTEERGAIGQIKPSGWQTVKYNDLIDGSYLYNRCHLIGYQLAGENANEKNLITGTRYLNVDGMLPFENEVTTYVKETNHHVLYRVTPIFEGSNLVASGVQMEAWSVENQGAGVCFNVYCYNVQPGIVIDYANGDSYEDLDYSFFESATVTKEEADYVLNTNTMKIHLPSCESVADMKNRNKKYFKGILDELIDDGYSPCQRCLGKQ